MRITFVLPSKDISGGVKTTFELANRLQARGHEACVVYPLIPDSYSATRLDFKDLDRRARGLLLNLKKGNRVEWFDLQTKLVRVLRMGEAKIPGGDAIIATWWADAYHVDRCSPQKGVKFHIIRSYETWGGPEELVNKAYTLPLHKIAVSSWLKDLIESKFQVPVHGPLMNGVDMNKFYREKEGFEAHSPRRIGLLYRIAPLKGMRDALQAFAAVQEEYPDVQFVLFGEPPLPEDLKIMQRLRGLEFHKLPCGDSLRRIYSSLDIFVLPSHLEGFSNPPMEAMACGAACVTTDVGAVPDYNLAGETALVVKPGQPGEMAAAILTLLADEGKRRNVAQVGYEYIKGFSWDNCVDRLEKTIRDVISATCG